MDLMIMFCLLAGVGVVSVSADNFLITNQAVMDGHDATIARIVDKMAAYFHNLTTICDEMSADFLGNMKQPSIDMRVNLLAKISEAQQLREMDVKRMLLALRQPYARVRDRLNGINSVIPTRTQNLADANVPFFEGFIESLPDLSDAVAPAPSDMTLSAFLRNNPAGLTSDDICGNL